MVAIATDEEVWRPWSECGGREGAAVALYANVRGWVMRAE